MQPQFLSATRSVFDIGPIFDFRLRRGIMSVERLARKDHTQEGRTDDLAWERHKATSEENVTGHVAIDTADGGATNAVVMVSVHNAEKILTHRLRDGRIRE